MITQDIAALNLQEFSQNTQYIFDWHLPLQSKQHKILPKPSEERLSRKSEVSAKAGWERTEKEKTEKERKTDVLSRFQFPLLGDSRGGKKEPWVQAIDGVIDEEFRKLNQHIYESLVGQRQERLLRQYQTHHITLKHGNNGLPALPGKKLSLRSTGSLPKLGRGVILIDQEEGLSRKLSVGGFSGPRKNPVSKR